MGPIHPVRASSGASGGFRYSAAPPIGASVQRRLGSLAHALEVGRPGKLFKWAKSGVLIGEALHLARRRGADGAQHLASLLYLASGLAFRFAWVGAGRTSARDDQAVAAEGRR
jgi:hypothetical protein